MQYSSPGMVAQVQVDYVGQNMMSQLLARLDRLEVEIQHDRSTGGLLKTQSQTSGMVSHDQEVVVA